MNNTELLQKQFAAISKAGNDVTLRSDNARAFVLDVVSGQETLGKLPPYFAKSSTGSIDKLGVKRRTMRTHKGTATTPTGSDIAEESSVSFTLSPFFVDAWIENSNVFYTAQTRGQDVRQALTTLMQQQFGADLQDLAFNGDTASKDEFLKQKDGFIKKAQAGAVVKLTPTALPTIETLTTDVVGGFESKYINSNFKWFMSLKTSTHYVAEIQSRATNLGDVAIVNGQLTNIAGFAVEVVDNFPDKVVLFSPFENLTPVLGYEVKMQTAAADSTSIAKQATYHFVLTSADFVIRELKMVGVVTVTP